MLEPVGDIFQKFHPAIGTVLVAVTRHPAMEVRILCPPNDDRRTLTLVVGDSPRQLLNELSVWNDQ